MGEFKTIEQTRDASEGLITLPLRILPTSRVFRKGYVNVELFNNSNRKYVK